MIKIAKKNKISLIFSIYPLTNIFRDKLEHSSKGTYQYLELSTIRKKGIISAVLYFMKLPCDKLILASEGSENDEVMSVLKSLSLVSRAKDIYLLSDNFHLKKISRIKILLSIFQIISATISGLYALIYASFDMSNYNKNSFQNENRLESDNVLYLNMNLWYGVKVGGSVGHIAGVINELNRNKKNVHYAAISDSSVIDSNVNRVLLKSPNSFGLPPEINSYRFDHFNYRRLKNLSIKIKPSYIYQRLSICSYMGAKLANKLKIPLIVEYNGSEVWIARNWGRPLVFEKIAKKAEDLMLNCANVVVTISDVLKDELINRGVNPNKIVYYPNCIDPEIFNPNRFNKDNVNKLKSDYNLCPEAKLVMFLGTFGQWHGVDILAKSIVNLRKQNRSWLDTNKIKFLLVGDGLKMSLVRDIIKKGDAEDYCIFTGLVEQNKAPLFLASANLLLSPHVRNSDGTKFFGSPTKLFEYLSMGKAVIASNLDQIGEVLVNSIHFGSGETDEEANKMKRVAYLVEPGDSLALSKAIVDIFERPSLINTLEKNSIKLALEKYTWKRHLEEILKKL